MTQALKDKRHAYWRTPIYIGLEIAVYVALAITLDTLLVKETNLHPDFTDDFNPQFLFKSIYRGFYFILFSTGYYFLLTYLNEKKRSNELEQIRLKSIIREQRINEELTKSQNAYLRAQINPHFLFNTLDFIYHNTRKTSPLAAEAISTLSEIMRYAIDTEYTNERCVVGEEIEQIESLIQLHKLKENAHINLQYSEEIKQIKMIPLVLITLTENMFKHGDLTNDQHPASIDLFKEDNMLHVKTENLINTRSKAKSMNTGLNNVAKRLEYSYGNKVNFSYKVTEQSRFTVSLSVAL